MLQWGVKLIWEPELLNLLLKLVFDRKLISHAREEDVEDRREGEGGMEENESAIGVFCISGLLLHWPLCLDSNLFLLHKARDLQSVFLFFLLVCRGTHNISKPDVLKQYSSILKVHPRSTHSFSSSSERSILWFSVREIWFLKLLKRISLSWCLGWHAEIEQGLYWNFAMKEPKVLFASRECFQQRL